LPVSDVARSCSWYCETLGFSVLLDYEEADELVGHVLEHPNGMTLGLHHDPERARAVRGFAIVAFQVPTRHELDEWEAHLDRLGVTHTRASAAHLGWCVNIPDPDGIVVQLHTPEQPSADEA
jgi:catechol-2,3-dioxygenase